MSMFRQRSLPHLVGVPGLGALTARTLTGGDLEVLGGHADGALDAQLLALGAVDELLADLLQRGDLAAGQGDPDLVDLGLVELGGLLGVLERHVGRCWWWYRGNSVTTADLYVSFTSQASRIHCISLTSVPAKLGKLMTVRGQKVRCRRAQQRQIRSVSAPRFRAR